MHAIRFHVNPGVWIAEDAAITGDVSLSLHCNIWHHVVIRGDVAPIRLGARVNVQDHSMLHCRHGSLLEIEDDTVIGHQAVVHGRRIGRGSLIGIRAVVLDDAVVGANCIIAAGSIVTPRTVIPDGSVVMGVPGRVVRAASDADREMIRDIARRYVDLARDHERGKFPAWTSPDAAEHPG